MTVERRRRKHRIKIRITDGKVTETSLFSTEESTSSVPRRRRQSRSSPLVRKACYDVPLKIGQKVKFRVWSGTTKIVEEGVIVGIDGIVVHIKAKTKRQTWSILYDKHKGLMWL